MTEVIETTYQVWQCSRCRKACKFLPPVMEIACRCANPVPGLHPTTETLVRLAKPRPVQGLANEEGRLRGLARKGQRVRVTIEAEVSEAWLAGVAGGVKRIQFVVTTADGRSHGVDPYSAGVHIETADDPTPSDLPHAP